MSDSVPNKITMQRTVNRRSTLFMNILELSHNYPIRTGIVIGLLMSLILTFTGVW